MKVTYSIPLQTVSLEWTPKEQIELGVEYRAMLKDAFVDMIEQAKKRLGLKHSESIDDMIDKATP